MIKEKAYAKVNLSLDVLRRREDGYHDVKMIMQTVEIYDELTFEPIALETNIETTTETIPSITPKNSIQLRFNNLPENVDLGPIEKNLIYRAAKLVFDEYDIKETGVIISLTKNIPVAAGMAGGSTDAAAVFKGLNKLLNLNMTVEKMCELGVKIGADVPFCIKGGACLSEGIGEKLTSIAPAPDCVLLIAKPQINVSTKFVYENLNVNRLESRYHPDVDAMCRAMENHDLTQVANLLGNILETVTVKEYPVIQLIKDLMNENGAMNSLMSGSGPTVFGIYAPQDIDKALNTAELIKTKNLAQEVFVTSFI